MGLEEGYVGRGVYHTGDLFKRLIIQEQGLLGREVLLIGSDRERGCYRKGSVIEKRVM